MMELNTQAVILAAGRSTRFKTKQTKILFNICGRTMILYPLMELQALNIPVTMVLGYQNELVRQEIENANIKNVSYVVQEQQLGTGHAVAISQPTWHKDHILILNGDMPLVTKNLFQDLLTQHIKSDSAVSFCTSMVIDPRGYGRVIEKDGQISIVEEKNCTREQRSVMKVNAGIYVVKRDFLEKNINKITKDPVTGEVYFPEIIKMAYDQGFQVCTNSVPYDEVRGVNTLEQLWSVEQIKRSEFIKYWMSQGVRFELAQSIHIDINVKLTHDCFIGTGVHLLGNTSIEEGCTINAFTILENVKVGKNSKILWHSVIQDSTIGDNVQIGPFARIRNDSVIGNDSSIGNFVEITASKIGNKTRTRHLSYLGNATIGNDVNIGAGTITCNYDGIKKNKTIIEDNAFIGSNNTLIAPINIGQGAYTAGGSTLTKDVPSQSLAIGRSQQETKLEYAHKIREKIESRQKKDTPEKQDKTDKTNDDKKDESEPDLFTFKGAVKAKIDHKNPL